MATDTELDIVNAVLRANGEEVTSTLSTQHPSVIQAKDLIASSNLDFQSRGWWFNRERNYKLLPDNENMIKLPDETLQFQQTQNQLNIRNGVHKERYVDRGRKVYDNLEHTYEIPEAIYADLILLRPINELPAIAASYLKHLCREQVVVDDDGDQQKVDRIKEAKAEAWHRLYSHELKTTAQNALDSPAAQQLRYRIGSVNTPSNSYFPGGRGFSFDG